MLLASLERLRALPRALEITRTLVSHGLHDFVHSAGMHRAIDEVQGAMGWDADPALASLPLAERTRLALEALGPAFVKLGQVLASRVDILGPEWIASLDQLHDHAAAVDFASLETQLVQDLGGPIASRFASFDTQPRAAGSIAQVHHATLSGGGEVAVKIRRPGVAARVESDVQLLEALAAWWEEEDPESRRYQPVELVRQLRRSLAREVDFAAEARAQERFAESFRASADIVVPRVHAEFTRASLLVMDWVDGIPATQLQAIDAAGLDRQLLAARGADAVLKMVLEDGFFHADPHPGNVFFLPGERVALIDFGMVGWLSTKRRDELVDLLAAVATRDPEAMRDVLVAWADGRKVNAERFVEDLGRLLHLYEHAALREISVGTLLGEVAGVMRENQLVLPPDLALLFKSLITLEGLGTRLVPRFRLIEHVTPYVNRLVAERWTPRRAAERASAITREMGRAMRAAPRLVEELSRRFAEDGMAVSIDVKQVDALSSRVERGLDRLVIGLVTAALIVGSSLLLATSIHDRSTAASFFGGAGVAIALINSLWLIASIRQSHRHR